MKIKWRKMAPIRVQLIREMWLNYEENGEKKSIFSSKDKPVKGTATMYGYKKIGNNNVEFYYFEPDFKRDRDEGYEISAKWFKKIPKEPTHEE